VEVISVAKEDKGKILIVEDESDMMALLVRRAKERHHLECRTDSSGEQTIKIAKEFQPNVILMDMDLPVLNGFSLIRELKENPTTKDIPIIVFSAFSDELIREEAREMGAAYYYLKGNSLGNLFDVIENYVH